MKKNRSFRSIKIRFVTSLDLIKCLKQVKLQRLPITYAHIFLRGTIEYEYHEVVTVDRNLTPLPYDSLVSKV